MDAIQTYSLQELNARLLNERTFEKEIRVTMPVLYQCMCGYFFVVFNTNLIYGPLTDLPIAEFMTSREMNEMRADCANQMVSKNAIAVIK